MKNYWGGMAELGADTFWELYNVNKCCIFSEVRAHCTEEDKQCNNNEQDDEFLSSHSVNK